jgi:hypothetical protein
MKIKYMLIFILGMFLTTNSYSQSVDTTYNKKPINPLMESRGFLFLSVTRFGGVKFFLTPKSEPKMYLSGIPYYVTKVQPIKNDTL